MAEDKRNTAHPCFCLRGEGERAELRFVLRTGENLVGFQSGNHIELPVRGVSRRHARVVLADGRVSVEDLGSTNGTFVNGRRVTSAPLTAGDLVTFASVALQLALCDPGDAVDAPDIALVERASVATDQNRKEPTTDTPGRVTIPADWLRAFEALFELEAHAGMTDLHEALRILIRTLNARGSALLERSPDGRTIVTAVAGVFDAPSIVPRLESPPAGAARRHRGRLATVSLAGDPPMVAAFDMRTGGPGRSLVVTGLFAGWQSCGPFLAAFLRGLTPRLAPPATVDRRHRSQSDGELVFPPEVVPGESAAMRRLLLELRYLVSGDIPVLIIGESGVGKEIIARALHLSSRRASGPFIGINCAAIPGDLLEAELFGIEKGVATGVQKREGQMLRAQGGVIFLDEIGDLPPTMQVKLLRALQEREIQPIGARRALPLDARVISATSTDLSAFMTTGRFRPELYFRIAGATVRVPPLRERREDIPALVLHFVQRYAKEMGRYPRGITQKTLEVLCSAPWPGNVRQLQNEMRRLVYFCPDGQSISSEMLSTDLVTATACAPALSAEAGLQLRERVRDLERCLIEAALAQTAGNVGKAAGLLGLTRQGLGKKRRALGME